MREIKEAEVYTRMEAERLLRISQSTMMRLIRRGSIRAAKIGGQYRILGAELLRQFSTESHGTSIQIEVEKRPSRISSRKQQPKGRRVRSGALP